MIENKASEYENSIRVKSSYTKEDFERNPNIIIGMEYTYLPSVKNPDEAFERLNKLTGQWLSEWYQKDFYNKYPIINSDIIDDEIKDLEKFINEAKKYSIKEAFDKKNGILTSKENEKFEYLRLQNHYYKKVICDYFSTGNITCQVYAKYVLFYNWLKKLHKTYETPNRESKDITDSETINREKIENAFAFMAGIDPRKHKKIITDLDFQNLITWVSFYFENDFKTPEISKPIKRVNTSKGNVVYTFMRLFKDIHPTASKPDSLFELVKLCFEEYRNDKIENLSKTKQPQHYDYLIKNY